MSPNWPLAGLVGCRSLADGRWNVLCHGVTHSVTQSVTFVGLARGCRVIGYHGSIDLEGIEVVGIDPAQQHVEPLQSGDGANVDAVAADREIVALHQQETEIARERRMLEIELAELARRQ